MLLTFLSKSWIDFLISFICLAESSLRSLIIFNSRLLNSLSYISTNSLPWIQVLSCYGGSLEGRHCFGFPYLNFYAVIWASVALSFSLTSLHKQRNYNINKVSNSAINQVFGYVRNGWNSYLSSQ
jgi:hypothetical protein